MARRRTDLDDSSNRPNPFDLEIDKALNSIREELGRHPQIRKILPAAREDLARKIGEQLRELGVDAVKAAADRPDATAVDLCDVRRAHGRVSGRRTERNSRLLCIASALGGGAITVAVGLLLTPPASYLLLWWLGTGVLLTVAGVLVRLTYPRKSRVDSSS